MCVYLNIYLYTYKQNFILYLSCNYWYKINICIYINRIPQQSTLILPSVQVLEVSPDLWVFSRLHVKFSLLTDNHLKEERVPSSPKNKISLEVNSSTPSEYNISSQMKWTPGGGIYNESGFLWTCLCKPYDRPVL